MRNQNNYNEKLKSTLTACIYCLIAGVSVSQDDNSKFKLNGIRIGSGILNVSSYQNDKGILTELAKKSELANEMNNVKDDDEAGGNRYVYGNSHYVVDFSFGKESSKTLDYSFFGGLDYSENTRDQF